MAPGWMFADVSESLVGGYQETLLDLHRLPQGIVLGSAHPLLDHAGRLVPMASKHLYGCSGQILIYLDAHDPPYAGNGMRSSSCVSSAA